MGSLFGSTSPSFITSGISMSMNDIGTCVWNIALWEPGGEEISARVHLILPRSFCFQSEGFIVFDLKDSFLPQFWSTIIDSPASIVQWSWHSRIEFSIGRHGGIAITCCIIIGISRFFFLLMLAYFHWQMIF